MEVENGQREGAKLGVNVKRSIVTNGDFVAYFAGSPEDDYFSRRWIAQGRNFLGEGGIGQCNVTYRKHVALRCGCSVPAAQ